MRSACCLKDGAISACCIDAGERPSGHLQPHPQKQFPIRRAHLPPHLDRPCKQFRSIIRLLRVQHLVLAIHPSLNFSTLNQPHNVLLNLLNRPPKRSAHPIKPDSRKRLEVQNHSPVADEVGEVEDVRREVYIDVVARRVSGKQIQDDLEVAVQIRLYKFPDIRLLLDVQTECRVFQKLRLD